MPAIRKRAQRTALIASLSAWSLLALPLPTHATSASASAFCGVVAALASPARQVESIR